MKYKACLITVLALSSFLFSVTTTIASIRFTAEERLTQFEKELKITSEQTPKIKAVLDETEKKFSTPTKPEERGKKVGIVMGEEMKKMEGILTKEQFEKYKKLPLAKPGIPPKKK
jgi:hypothetical protein